MSIKGGNPQILGCFLCKINNKYDKTFQHKVNLYRMTEVIKVPALCLYAR